MEKPRKEIAPAFDIINKGVSAHRLPPVLIRVEGLYKAYGDRVLFRNVSFSIRRHEKVALLGENGSGKTTLLRILLGLDKDHAGKVQVNPSLKPGYFSQELENLSNRKAILEEATGTGVPPDEARLLLAGLLFRGDSVKKKIAHLSMGEKCRVAFAKLILSGSGLLVLDEPTNYMDVESREKIEEVLEDYRGGLVFVSHDRFFVRRIANRIIKIQGGTLKAYEGGFDYYLQKNREESLREKVEDYREVHDDIRRLECELAFLSGKLDEPLPDTEKEELNKKFILTARELRRNKVLLEPRRP